jgi:hypothetical protein
MPIFNGGRIGSNNVPFTGTKSDDPNYSNVSLLLNGNGTNGSTTFTDSSSYGHTVTPAGNAQISTTQSKFGGASMYFDGSGDYLEIPPSIEFDLGFGAFTVEAWIYLTANGTTASNETYWPIVNKHSIYNTTTGTGNNTAWDFRYGPQVGNKLVFVNRIQASNFTEGVNVFSKYSTAVNLSLNTWYHVAAVRDGTTLKLFLNGQDVTDTNTGNYDWSTINMSLDTGSVGLNKVRVGRMLGGSNPGTVVWYAVGYIDDLRITKGVARYTANFTPPTAQLPGAETGTFASGLWTGLEQCDAIRREIWPGFVPSIVTDGLVVHLDAGNSASYPGSGTTWYDLSGNGNNGTLVNGVSYSGTGGGSLVFDGVNHYVGAGNLGSFYTQGTISYWMYSTAVENYRNPFSTHYLGGNAGIRFEQYTTASPYGGFSVVIGNDSASYVNISYSPSSALSPNTWYNVVLVWNTTTNNATGYLNGIEKFSSSHSLWATTLPSISIGSGFNSSRYFKGNISSTKIYNKALTPSEVTQNFDALKGRYGL